MSDEERGLIQRATEAVLLEFAPKTRVRVTRAVVYEGEYRQVMHQLRHSLKPGIRRVGRDRESLVVIGVYRAKFEVLNEDSLELANDNPQPPVGSPSPKEEVISLKEKNRKLRDKVDLVRGELRKLRRKLKAAKDPLSTMWADSGNGGVAKVFQREDDIDD